MTPNSTPTCVRRIRTYDDNPDAWWIHPPTETLHDVVLHHRDGRALAAITVRGKGNPFTGVEWLQPYDEPFNLVYWRVTHEHPTDIQFDDISSRPVVHSSWDCREWNMWRGRPYGNEQRPRQVNSECGAGEKDDHIILWCEYEVDGIHTRQHWLFAEQENDNALVYDCVTTVENRNDSPLADYSQFFASYTQANCWVKENFRWPPARDWDNLDPAAWYLDAGGSLKSNLDAGIVHLEKFIVGRGSPIDQAGRLPHFPHSDGLVAAYWQLPVLVGLPTSRHWRHVLMTEAQHTAALSLGMAGTAMDYVLYPGHMCFAPGEQFTAHVRHVILRSEDLPTANRLAALYAQFAADHDHCKSLTGRG